MDSECRRKKGKEEVRSREYCDMNALEGIQSDK